MVEPIVLKRLFEILYEKSKLIDFVYYPQDKSISCSKRLIRLWNCSDTIKNVPETLVNNFVAPQDRNKVAEFFNNLSADNQKTSCVFKSITGNQTFSLEFRIAQTGENNEIISAVGVLEKLSEIPAYSAPATIISTGRKLKVLVVDDNKVNLLVAEGVFKNFNFDCSYVQSGQEAIDLCKKIQFDLIFMDLLMPEMDGTETKDQIRKLTGFETTPIIALTAATEQNAREELLNKGFNEFLAKPFNNETLSKTVSVFVSDIPAIDEAVDDKAQNLINKDILLQVYKDGIKKLRYFPELIENKDYSNYIIEVHALKSVMAAIGEQQLSDKAREHEIRGKNQEYDFIQNDFNSLLKSYSEVINKIGQQLEIKAPVQGNLPPLDSEALSEAVATLKTACADYDANKIKQVCHELQKHKCSLNIYEVINSIYDSADSYDYETVECKIEELSNNSVHLNLILVDRIQSFIGNTILTHLNSMNISTAKSQDLEKAVNSDTDIIALFVESDPKLITEQAGVCAKGAVKKLYLLGNEADILSFEKQTAASKIIGKFYRPINAKTAADQIAALI